MSNKHWNDKHSLFVRLIQNKFLKIRSDTRRWNQTAGNVSRQIAAYRSCCTVKKRKTSSLLQFEKQNVRRRREAGSRQDGNKKPTRIFFWLSSFKLFFCLRINLASLHGWRIPLSNISELTRPLDLKWGTFALNNIVSLDQIILGNEVFRQYWSENAGYLDKVKPCPNSPTGPSLAYPNAGPTKSNLV